jgi:two-component system sensor histidine kinase HydH
VEALLLAGEREEAVGFLVLIRATQSAEQGDGGSRLVRQERLATMGEMAAQLAHELRNPLVAVGASLDSLARDAQLAAEHRDLVSAVADEVLRMDMLLKDYLAARHEPCFAEVELADVARDARRLLESAYRLAGKRVLLAPADRVVVRGDHEALKHVVFNLLLNALEASPPAGEVRCSVCAQERTASIVVEDCGPGLGASVEECLRPFFTTKKNGTGLGLPVCQRIAHAHGGLVEIANRPAGGCRAALVLPRHSGVDRRLGQGA